MTTYLLPVYHPIEGVYIEKCRATGFTDSHAKFIRALSEDYELDYPADWKDLIRELNKQDIVIGDIYDIEEF